MRRHRQEGREKDFRKRMKGMRGHRYDTSPAEPPPVSRDDAQRIARRDLEKFFALHQVRAAEWMYELEARIGGLSVGKQYAYELGFRNAIWHSTLGGRARPLPRTPDGERVLLLIGVRCDTFTYVSEDGAVWMREDTFERDARRVEDSFDAFSLACGWPPETRGEG
jgi:hypothetical protein